jgi:SAM-dependent methyltransferase
MSRPDHEYVLGTHDVERDRLATQHALWLDEVRHAWRAAGITRGSRVLDLGCGPGLSIDSLLAEVGPEGRVAGLEISPDYVAQAKELAQRHGRRRPGHETDIRTFDLTGAPLPADMRGQFDATWCRWVCMWVNNPAAIVAAARDALVPGGRAVFHEYVCYETYALHPHGPRTREFVQRAVKSYATEGGNPNIGRELPTLLSDAGMEVTSVRPIARTARPSEPLWNWPAGFIRTYGPRLADMGYADAAWVAELLAEVEGAAALGDDGGAFFLAPTVLEVVATKR